MHVVTRPLGESGGPITHDMNSPEIYGTVFALAPGKKTVNLLWAGLALGGGCEIVLSCDLVVASTTILR